MRQHIQALVMFIALFVTLPVFAADYTIDSAHSTFGFSVKHMMISNVPGSFDKFEGTVSYDPNDLANAKANVTIDVASINTRNEKRDEHLRGADFFDAAKYPTINFVATKFTPEAITGNLTMKGVTKEITIPVTISGPVKTMVGGQAIGITGSVTIDRQDFGINYNKTLDQGGLALGNDVLITVNIEAAQKG